MIAINRLSNCERTRAYVNKRSPDGKADLDILRRLKRYIAREVYKILIEDVPVGTLEQAASKTQVGRDVGSFHRLGTFRRLASGRGSGGTIAA
jgi:predicted acetyltransferase